MKNIFFLVLFIALGWGGDIMCMKIDMMFFLAQEG